MTTALPQAGFIKELDKLKAIRRQLRLPEDDDRQENSAEHSWHVAASAMMLKDYAAEKIAIDRVIMMILLHDLVEIDAGDMFAFAQEQDHAEQALKELAAAKRIFGLLPEAQAQNYLELWLEFEAAETADARFAKAMDRVLPVFQNMQNKGGSWARHGVTKQQILARNVLLKDCAPVLWDYVNDQLTLAQQHGWLPADE